MKIDEKVYLQTRRGQRVFRYWINLFFEIDEKRKSLTVPRQIVFVGRVILERETHLKFKLPAAIGDAN